MGILVDALGVMNVPGTLEPMTSLDGTRTLNSLGTGVFMIALVAWVAVFWRGRMPWLTLAAGGVLTIIGVSYLLLLIGAISCVRRMPRWTLAVGGATSALVLLFAIREATTPWGGALAETFGGGMHAQYEPVWIGASFIWAVLSLGVAAGIVFLTRARDRVVRTEVRAAEQQQRADSLSEQMVRQSERERIARDMHDQLSSRLSVVSLHAGALESASVPGDTADIARTVREQTHAALQDLRGLLGDLRSGPGASSPATMRALAALIAEKRAAGAAIDAYVVVESPERASTEFEAAVYRIVQEALTNALKHAPRARIDLYVAVEPTGGARIRVVNPLGTGGPSSVPGGGNGVVGIRERAEALGGTAWIGPSEGSFIVDVTLPWQERAQG